MIQIGLFIIDCSTVMEGAVRIAYEDKKCPTMRISSYEGLAMMLETPVIDGVDIDGIDR